MKNLLKEKIKQGAKRLRRLGIPEKTPLLVRTLHHDTTAFTQGLTFHDGLLYESVGKPNASALRIIDPADGRVLRTIPFEDPAVWGEGVAVLNGRIIQLTWKHQFGRVYSVPDLERFEDLPYRGEGWGLAAGEGGLIMSDGTHTLTFCDECLKPRRRLRVTLNRFPLSKINDLECCKGMIYANVWYEDQIMKIDSKSGKVVGIYDCSDLKARAEPSQSEQVLNGIAYNPANDTFFVTGKCWRYIFELRLT